MRNEDFSHDLFHFYSETIHPDSVRNWVVEEGIAYSWGNAYYTKYDGEMGEQSELVNILQDHLRKNENMDLLKLFEENFWRDNSGIYDSIAPDFAVGRLMSSLICDAVEEKHGMKGVLALLTCTSKPSRFEAFYKAVDKLIGVNRSNFAPKIKELIMSYDK